MCIRDSNITSNGQSDVFVLKLNSAGQAAVGVSWQTTDGSDTNYGSITLGGTSGDYSYWVAVDGAGNVYTTGNFSGTVNFGAGVVVSAGDRDAYVSKYNAAGAHQWTTTFGGTGADWSYGVAVDGAGNVHVAGYFTNTVDFGAGNVTSNGNTDVFVTKLNSSGAHQWTTTFGGTGTDYSLSLIHI